MENLELKFLAGDYFEYEIPSEKSYLPLYFTSEVQQHFLKYFLRFKEIDFFLVRTGQLCSVRHIKRMRETFLKLEEAVQDAKKAFDLDALETINSGKWRKHVEHR